MRQTSLLCLCLCAMSASSADAQWHVDPKPTLDIGGATGADEYLFTRIEGLARMSDGRILVADQRMIDVRVFDATGKFVMHVGQKGRGPGEYSHPYWAGVARGDTIYVYDYSEGPGTLLRYAPSGAFIKSAMVLSMADAAAALPFKLLRDGSLLLKGSVPASYPRERPRPYRGESGVIRFSFVDSVTNVLRIPGGIIEVAGTMKPWFVDGRVAATDSLLYVGDGETPTIKVYGLDGALRRSATVAIPRRSVTAQDKEDWRKNMAAASERDPRMKASIDRQVSLTVFPDAFPLYQTWMTDLGGNLWVGLPHGFGQASSSTEYLVFSELLQQIARAVLPAGFTPKEIGRDYVLGVVFDSDDVPHVRMHRLLK